MKNTAIIIPCYNEENRLKPEEFLDCLKASPYLHFFFVNDGSKDKTLNILNKMAEQSSQCHAVDLGENHGKAFAVFSGFNTALEGDYDNIGFWDADLATPLNVIPEFCQLLDSGKCQAVFGCRIKRLGSNIQRHVLRHYLGRFFATLVSHVLKLPVYDTQCGAKIFRNSEDLKKVFTTPFTTKWVFDVQLISRFQKISKNSEIAFANTVYEYPLEEWHDVDGSKIKLRDGFFALLDLLRIKLKR